MLARNPDLPSEIEQRRRRLVERLQPFDAVLMLGQLVLSEMSFAPDTYVESEHEGAAYVVELIAAALLSRPERHGSAAVSPPIDANALGPIRELAVEMALLEGLRRFHQIGARASEKELAGAQGNAAISHLVVRGPGWPWQEEALIKDLFAPFASELTSELGFDAAQAVACSQAAGRLVMSQFLEHERSSGEHMTDALAWADEALPDAWRRCPPGPARDRALAAVWGLMQAGEAMLLTPGALAAAASVPHAVAAAYMQSLSTVFGQSTELFAVAEQVRFAPFIPVREGFFLTVPGGDLWALRLLFEGILKDDATCAAAPAGSSDTPTRCWRRRSGPTSCTPA